MQTKFVKGATHTISYGRIIMKMKDVIEKIIETGIENGDYEEGFSFDFAPEEEKTELIQKAFCTTLFCWVKEESQDDSIARMIRGIMTEGLIRAIMLYFANEKSNDFGTDVGLMFETRYYQLWANSQMGCDAELPLTSLHFIRWNEDGEIEKGKRFWNGEIVSTVASPLFNSGSVGIRYVTVATADGELSAGD